MTSLNIEMSAPVVVEMQVEIAAAPAEVWAAMIDVGDWHAWNAMIDTAELRVAAEPGAVIHWTTSGIYDRPAPDPRRPRSCAGLGRVRHRHERTSHSWRFEPNGSGTMVNNSESMSGGFASKNSAEMKRLLTLMVDNWNKDLKSHVERHCVGLQNEPHG